MGMYSYIEDLESERVEAIRAEVEEDYRFRLHADEDGSEIDDIVHERLEEERKETIDYQIKCCARDAKEAGMTEQQIIEALFQEFKYLRENKNV